MNDALACLLADCSECVELTGEPCRWADDTRTLCSRCADEQPALVEARSSKTTKPARKRRAKGAAS